MMADDNWGSTMYGEAEPTKADPPAAPKGDPKWAESMYAVEPPIKMDEPAPAANKDDQPAPAAADTAPVVVPEKYEFDLPEDLEIDPAVNTELQAALKEAKLPPDQAKKLVNLHVKTVRAQQEAFDRTLQSWSDETMTALGDTAPEVFGHAKAALERFDKQGKIRELLNSSGLGNRVEFVRLFEQIGRNLEYQKAYQREAARKGVGRP